MPVIMKAKCDKNGCRVTQSFYLDSSLENGNTIVEGLLSGGWRVEGDFNGTLNGLRLTCPVCTNKKG